MKYKLARVAGVVAVALVASTLSISGVARKPADAATLPAGAWDLNAYGPRSSDDVILKWDEQLLNTIRAYPAQTGPTIASRALGVLHTATYDAWAAYDPVAKVTRPDGPKQQPSSANTIANKSKAISFAAYNVLLDLFPDGSFPATGPHTSPNVLMASLGYSPSDTTGPATVGNQAATAVLKYRHNDGSNQLNGYADTTGYTSFNKWNDLKDRWRWQPQCMLTGAAAAKNPPPALPRDPTKTCPDTSPPTDYALQVATTPQWGKIIPFGAIAAAQQRVIGPRKNPDGTCCTTADTIKAYNETSGLENDDVARVKADYWADGPKSEFPPGHTAVFAQAISRKYGFSLDKDVQMFFALGNAVMDAGIASWAQKFKYDFVRPVTAIREQYKGQMIKSWLGPGKGFGLVPADQWIPYQQLNVVTPPFPEYPSGHSTFTGAGAIILRSYLNSDNFGAYVTIAKGNTRIEPGVTPAAPVTLYWSTFTFAADEAGMSRRYGGIHFYTGDTDGRLLGDLTGRASLSQATSFIKGYTGY